MKIAILHNKISETDSLDNQDTLEQRNFVQKVLLELGHQTIFLSCDLNLLSLIYDLEKIKPDLVFNLVETLNGKGRYIDFTAAILEELEIPFTGSSAETLYFTSNKLLTKKNLKENHLNTPLWSSNAESVLSIFGKKTSEIIIKSVWEHASIGLDENSILSLNNLTQIQKNISEKKKSYGGD